MEWVIAIVGTMFHVLVMFFEPIMLAARWGYKYFDPNSLPETFTLEDDSKNWND